MRSNWTWDKRSFKQSSRSQLSWTCARIACKSSTGRMRRIIWLQSTRFKWKQLTRQDVFSTLSKTISKDQTQCLSVTTLQPVTQTQSRTYAQYQMSRRHWCTIVSMSRTGAYFFDCTCGLVSPISCLFKGGNRKSSNLGKSRFRE